MRNDNKHKASLTLAFVTTGFLLCYPFANTFWGGLSAAGFSAAMVGGLADWYAVTALFRRPLGIPWRTAIIPKNRKRIFVSIITMVEKELLTAENVRVALKQAGLGGILFKYVSLPEARDRLYLLVEGVVKNSVSIMDAKQFSTMVELLISSQRGKIKYSPLIGQAIDWSLKDGFADRLLNLIITELKALCGHAHMIELLGQIYESALKVYTAEQNRRKLLGWIMTNMLNLDSLAVAKVMQQRLIELLDELYSREHPLRRRAHAWLAGLAEELQRDDKIGEKVDTYVEPIIVHLASRFAELANDNPSIAAALRKWVVRQAERIISELTLDESRQAKLDALLVEWLASWVGINQGEVGRLVAQQLERYSNDELVEFIESKVMNDLQMIRINGSVVGGLAGIMLFIITYALGVTR